MIMSHSHVFKVGLHAEGQVCRKTVNINTQFVCVQLSTVNIPICIFCAFQRLFSKEFNVTMSLSQLSLVLDI